MPTLNKRTATSTAVKQPLPLISIRLLSQLLFVILISLLSFVSVAPASGAKRPVATSQELLKMTERTPEILEKKK